MHVGHMGMNLLQQAFQAQTAAASAPASQARAAAFAAAANSVDEADDADEAGETHPAPRTAGKGHGGPASGANGPRGGLLAPSTLASLLGLQVVNGHAEGGDDGEDLADIAVPGGSNPHAQPSEETPAASSPEA